MNAVQIVEVMIGGAKRKYAYRSITLADFIAIRRGGVRPKYHPSYDSVVWFSDSYEETRGYNDQLTIRFPWPDTSEEITTSHFVSPDIIPVSVVEVEVDLTGEWVPIRRATLRRNMVVKR